MASLIRQSHQDNNNPLWVSVNSNISELFSSINFLKAAIILFFILIAVFDDLFYIFIRAYLQFHPAIFIVSLFKF
jgi:hypothetical protein